MEIIEEIEFTQAFILFFKNYEHLTYFYLSDVQYVTLLINNSVLNNTLIGNCIIQLLFKFFCHRHIKVYTIILIICRKIGISLNKSLFKN